MKLGENRIGFDLFSHYSSALNFLRQNEHLHKRRDESGDEYYSVFCHICAVAISMINSRMLKSLEDTQDLRISCGTKKDDASRRRLATTLSLGRIMKTAKELEIEPLQSSAAHVIEEPFCNVIYARRADDPYEETCGAHNFITSFCSFFQDKVTSSLLGGGYHWQEYQRERKANALPNEFLSALSRSQQQPRRRL